VSPSSQEAIVPNRRDFIRNAAGATAGVLVGHRLADSMLAARQVNAKPGKRREATIGGRRVRTVDVHAHCFVPEVWDLVKDTPLAATAKGLITGTIALGNAQRLIDMDAQGIDYQVINVNAWGYSADRALARDLVALQNEKISQWCAKHPDRFVGMATLALQHPDLAAEQLEQAVRKLGSARRRDRRQRRGTGAVRSQVRSVLGEGRGARRAALHAPAAGAGHDAEHAIAGEGCAREYDRKSARDPRCSSHT
jgi:hypothetical protein